MKVKVEEAVAKLICQVALMLWEEIGCQSVAEADEVLVAFLDACQRWSEEVHRAALG